MIHMARCLTAVISLHPASLMIVEVRVVERIPFQSPGPCLLGSWHSAIDEYATHEPAAHLCWTWFEICKVILAMMRAAFLFSNHVPS